MKTRFLIAITHELPGADFRSAAGESLRTFHLPETAGRSACARNSPPIRRAPPADDTPHGHSSGWWRFASAWRRKPVDNSIPAAGRKNFFRSLTAGIASAALLFAAG